MNDVTNLVTGVVTAWKTSVEVFDVIASGESYGKDYEIAQVKLEVERIRLLMWGDTVGLNGDDVGQRRLDARLHREDIRGATLRLLGCIQHIFDQTDQMNERYGLRPATSLTEAGRNEEISAVKLGAIFRRASDTFRKTAKTRQRQTARIKKTRWAIHDKRAFQVLVSEVTELIDKLYSLFPETRDKTKMAMQNEILQSNDEEQLASLQEATADSHEEIWETTSIRLESLREEATIRSEASKRSQRVPEEKSTSRTDSKPSTNANQDPRSNSQDPYELERQYKECFEFVHEKSRGCLSLAVIGPAIYTSYTFGYYYFECVKGQREEDVNIQPFPQDNYFGLLINQHASFDLYHRKRFTNQDLRFDGSHNPTPEDEIILDVESFPLYGSINPGTVTVAGFGLECWEYEDEFGKKRDKSFAFSSEPFPPTSFETLLRRIEELRTGSQNLGLYPLKEEADLTEIFGNLIRTHNGGTTHSTTVLEILRRLNGPHPDFANFTIHTNIFRHWSLPMDNENLGYCNLLQQIILSRELQLRLQHPGESNDVLYKGFTAAALASLTIGDLWLRNVRIILQDARVPLLEFENVKKDQAKAEELKAKGNTAIKDGRWEEAAHFYTEAIKRDPGNSIYRANRSAAFMSMGNYQDSCTEAYEATRLDPNYAKAWARLGMAELKLGLPKRAQSSYRRAISLTGDGGSTLMKKGFEEATAKIKEELHAIAVERNEIIKIRLRNENKNQEFSLQNKTAVLHSAVHECQVEGLLAFAESIKWPYINEVRDCAEGAYENILTGIGMESVLQNWLFGLTLPGRFMSFTIMSALIICTPSIKSVLMLPPQYDSGISMSGMSYWRTRTVLARVLGCRPGTVSVCGWVGPCPPMEFDPPLVGGLMTRPRHINIKTRRVAPMKPTTDTEMDLPLGMMDRYEATRLKADEEMPEYISEMRNEANWVIPEPPVQDLGTVTLTSIKLRKLPLERNIMMQLEDMTITEELAEREVQYRATMTFRLDNNAMPVTYALYTNPIFVSPPGCLAGHKGPHQVHIRELPRFQKNVLTVDQLKNHTIQAEDDVTIINATGKGAEVLARAWCTEQGKNAIIRRTGGPCYVCAVRAATKAALGTGVLIWV